MLWFCQLGFISQVVKGLVLLIPVSYSVDSAHIGVGSRPVTAPSKAGRPLIRQQGRCQQHSEVYLVSVPLRPCTSHLPSRLPKDERRSPSSLLPDCLEPSKPAAKVSDWGITMRLTGDPAEVSRGGELCNEATWSVVGDNSDGSARWMPVIHERFVIKITRHLWGDMTVRWLLMFVTHLWSIHTHE